MTHFELLVEGEGSQVPGAHALVWPRSGGNSGTVRSTVDPWLMKLGAPGNATVDMVRIAAGAYMADRLTRRPTSFSRTIDLTIHLTDVVPWDGPLDTLADLLFWLSGDTWNLEVIGEETNRTDIEPEGVSPIDVVSLLSGGLDSFCAAVLACSDESRRLYCGHWDNPIVKHSQDVSWSYLTDEMELMAEYHQVSLTEAEQKKEASTRSRTLLFIALAIAMADARGASRVEIPENGYTSLNLPLGADRGGALSTRSTHPATLQTVNELTQALGISIELRDPHIHMTKGALLSAAVAVSPASFPSGAANTLSCSKLDGRWYPGGNTNHHCGLCIPCLVRRGAFIAAGLQDDTLYLSDYLTGDALEKLHRNRADDVNAVRYSLSKGIDEIAVMANGPYTDDLDYDAAFEICTRGLEELRAIPLP